MKIFHAALAAAAFIVPASAQATVVFNVNGTFSNGATLTGTFSTDDARSSITAVNLVSTLLGGATYTDASKAASSVLPNFLQIKVNSPDRLLLLSFSPALSATGATIASNSYEWQGNDHNFYLLSGSVTAAAASTAAAVPEPATWAMMLIGFGAIGLAMRNSRKRSVRIRYA